MKFSNFQENIFSQLENTESHMCISAVAGSGKTTTIEECVKRVPPKSDKIFLAFNNTVVDELKKRIKQPNVKIQTLHGFCWSSMYRAKGNKVELDKTKSFKIADRLIKKNKDISLEKRGFYSYCIIKIVDLIRLNLIEDENDIYQVAYSHGIEADLHMVEISLKTLELMNLSEKKFDFTDMIYRAYLDEIRLPKFDYIFVDESQDLSKLHHAIIPRILKRKGRMIAVGDPKQAIYGFAGADSNSYYNLKNLFANTIEMPLSVNYRCGKRIVEEAKKYNSQIQPYPGNSDGIVKTGFCRDVKGSDWVLCRNLKPLIFMNLYLLQKGVKSYIKGLEIGKNLENFIRKFNAKGIDDLLNKIDKNILIEVGKMKRKGVRNPYKTDKIDKLTQTKDIIEILSKNCNSVSDLLSGIKQIFKVQKNAITLSTIHKSKGLENDNVFILCPELIPSEYATQPWQIEQENHLMYVAITRAKNKLVYIDDYSDIEKKIKKLRA